MIWRRRAPARDEPRPPWAMRPSMSPADDPWWGGAEGAGWLRTVFLPFYDTLPPDAQTDYWTRWNAPPAWVTLFLHPDLDELAAEVEADDGEAVQAENYRTRFLG